MSYAVIGGPASLDLGEKVAKRLDAFKESLKEKVAVMNEELKNQLGN